MSTGMTANLVEVAVRFGRDRKRTESLGWSIEDIDDEDLEALHEALARDARAQGVQPTAEWLAACAARLVGMYGHTQGSWVAARGVSIAPVFDARLPSGLTVRFGCEAALALARTTRLH